MTGPMGVARHGGQTRTTPLALGAPYRVVPLNPNKLTHRNRRCRLLSLFDRNRHPLDPPPEGIVDPDFDAALVRFEDTGLVGRVDPADLVPEGP
jgi:hypothetical protein